MWNHDYSRKLYILLHYIEFIFCCFHISCCLLWNVYSYNFFIYKKATFPITEGFYLLSRQISPITGYIKILLTCEGRTLTDETAMMAGNEVNDHCLYCSSLQKPYECRPMVIKKLIWLFTSILYIYIYLIKYFFVIIFR